MKVVLLLITDGRADYLERTLNSAQENLPEFADCIFVDDTDHELGFGGSIREGWRRVLKSDADWVLHLEDDFVLERPVPVDEMVSVLEANPYLVQMALLRAPWNEREKEAGSILNIDAECYTQVHRDGHSWIEHRRNFTTNPSLYRRSLCERGWPESAESEGVFGGELLKADKKAHFAYWGTGEPWCTHIGDVRVGVGY